MKFKVATIAQLVCRRLAFHTLQFPRGSSSSSVRYCQFLRCRQYSTLQRSKTKANHTSPSFTWLKRRETHRVSYVVSILVTAACFFPTRLAGDSEVDEDLKGFAILDKGKQIDGDLYSMTSEHRMLEASEREKAEKRSLAKSKEWPLYVRIWASVVYVVKDWVYEPLATAIRFGHLVLIFVPVILAVPMIWVGPVVSGRPNTRKGTLWWYGFLINSMERAGATFIKLGQWAASRTDIFPNEMCEMMSRLHSNVDAHSMEYTRQTIEKAFGGIPFEDIFQEFDEKPLGIGAIAQVYKAKLRPSFLRCPQEEEQKNFRKRVKHGVDVLVKSSPQKIPSSSVAIKVLHPKVDKIVNRDLRIMHCFATVLNAIPTLEWLSLPDEVCQFGEMMRLQLDLRIEGHNLQRFRKNFNHRNTVTFPMPYLEYSSRDVLIEEFAHGISLSEFLHAGGGVYQTDIADMGLDAFLHMLLIDNFIHADLHPGNIMVRFYKPEKLDIFSRFSLFPGRDLAPNNHKEVTEEALSRLRPHLRKPKEWQEELAKLDQESYRPQLIFIDTGLVTELNEQNRRNFLDLFRAIAEFDGYGAGQLMVGRCRQPEAVIDQEVFCLKMQKLVLMVKAKTFSLGKIRIGDILNEVLTMIRTHHVRLEGDYINVVISTLLLEGIGRSLDPNIDLFTTSLPILRQLGAQSGAAIMHPKTCGTQQEDEGVAIGGLRAVLPLMKTWIALEARQFLASSVEDVEDCIKYDLISPNI